MKKKLNSFIDNDGDGPAKKKLKTSVSSKQQKGDQQPRALFTSLEFKNLLKEPQTRVQALNRFCKSCKILNLKDEGAVDIVKSYISSSPECTEIFKCFNVQNSPNELCSIFRSLLCILTRTASDLKELYEKVGLNVCGSILQSHMQKVYHGLGLRQSPRTSTTALKLLTMMVMQGKEIARQVVNNTDFSMRCFREILNKNKGKQGYDTRLAYIRFVLAFFMSDDAKTVQKVLDTQGLVSIVLRGLRNDPASVVQLILTTLRENAIKNLSVSKTAKAHFFAGHRVLNYFADLFDWDGVPDVALEGPQESVRDYIRQLVYDFLYHACCPFKYGINFKDATLGTGEKCKNHVLLDFAFHLLPLSSDALVRDLLVEILRACPDLLPRFMGSFRVSLEPKTIEIWLRNYELVKRTYEVQPDVATALTQVVSTQLSSAEQEEKLETSTLVKMTIPGIFSSNFNSLQVLKHCIKCKTEEIREKSLSLMFLFLQKAQASLGFASQRENWHKIAYSAEEIEVFVSELQNALMKNHINVPLVINVWKESCEKNAQQMKNLALKNLCILQELFPVTLKEYKFEFTKLLFGITSPQVPSTERKLIEQDDSEVLILKMLARTPNLYKWFKVVENGQSPFRRLLQIIYECQNKRYVLYKYAVVLFKNILVCNDVLTLENSSEAEIWIERLPSDVKTRNDDVILNFLSNICGQIVRMPVKYSDALKSERYSGAPTVGKDFWESLADAKVEDASTEDFHTRGIFSHETGDNASLISFMSVATLDELKTCDLFGEERNILENYLASVLQSILCTLPAKEEVKFFAQIFASLVENTQQFEVKFPVLQNFFVFLSLWNERKETSYKSRHEKDLSTYMQNWIWHVCKEKNHPLDGELIRNVTAAFESGKFCDCGRLLCQALLYFDTIHKREKWQKELLCAIAFLLQKINESVCAEEKFADLNKESKVCVEEDQDGSKVFRTQQLLWKRFLGNRRVQKLFLNDIHMKNVSMHPSEFEVCNVPGCLGSICTSISAKVLKLCSRSSADGCLKYFMSKIGQALPQILQDVADSKNEILPACNYAAFQLFKELCSMIPRTVLQTMLDDIADILEKIRAKDVAGLGGTLLCQSIKCMLMNNFYEINYQSWKKIFKFLSSWFSEDFDELGDLVAQLVMKIPGLAVIVEVSMVQHCTEKPCPGGAILASKAIQCNPSLLLDWHALSSISSMAFEDSLLLLPMLNQVLRMSLQDFGGKNELCNKKVKAIFDSFKSYTLSNSKLFQILGHGVEKKFAETMILCAVEHDEMEYVTSLLDSISLLKNIPGHVVNLVEAILSIGKHSQSTNTDNIKIIAISTLMNVVVQQKVKDSSVCTDKVFTILQSTLQNLTESIRDRVCQRVAENWNKFMKVTLKQRFESMAVMKCLLEMVCLFYNEDGAFKSVPTSMQDSIATAATFRHLIVSHSKFLSTVLVTEGTKNAENLPPGKNLKDILMELLLEVTLRCKASELLENDLSFLLGGYGGTLSRCDQDILKTILVYERKGISFENMKPFLWGQAAVSSCKARKNLGETLWKKPGPSDVLSCLDSQIMDATLARFPLRRRMAFIDLGATTVTHFENDPILTISVTNNDVLDSRSSSEKVYDPAFLLPVISHVLLPENLVDCKLFTRCGALSFLMACLSSHCASIRSTAASCLCMYYQHTQTAWFPENNLTMYLIRCVRDSIEPKRDDGSIVIPRLSSVVANFLAAVVRLHSAPEDHMFSVLHRFLLVKPQFDLKNIPEFYVLFFSAEMENKVERSWILNLIAGGLRDMGDYHIIKRRNVFQLLMCLHDSPISDNYSRRQIFHIFEQACTIRSAAIDLVKNYGLVPWLTQAASQQSCRAGAFNPTHSIRNPRKRQENTTHIVRVMSALWTSLNISDFIADDISETCKITQTLIKQETQTDKHASLVPFRVVKQLIRLSVALVSSLLRLVEHSSEVLSPNIVKCYEETLTVLSSCLGNLQERRKLDFMKKKNAEFLEDSCDLLTQDIHILLRCTRLLSRDESKKCMRSLTAVLTFWYPQAAKTDDELILWKVCLSWVFGDAFLFWSQNTDWIRSNYLKFLKWLNRWVSSSSSALQKEQRKAIDKCYSVACCNSSILSDQFLECLILLNGVLWENGEKICHGNEAATVLGKMQKIRASILLEDGHRL